MYTKTQHQDIMNSTMMHELCLIWKWGFHDRVMLFQKESEITLNIYLFKGLSFLHTIRFAYLLYSAFLDDLFYIARTCITRTLDPWTFIFFY